MLKNKILLVEDEPKVAAFIKNGLEENLYDVDIAYDGLIGKKKITSNDYDLIILDLNLPVINGYELCHFIRENKNATPVLMLTALSAIDDKLSGFDAGADDYLSKPFEFRELLARIRALIKRSQSTEGIPKNKIQIADLEVDLIAKSVKRGAKKINLTAKEFLLLEYLLKNKNRVVSRADIAEKVWDVGFDTGTNVIDVYVNFLRKKIDKDFEPKLIHTVVGMGYILKDDAE